MTKKRPAVKRWLMGCGIGLLLLLIVIGGFIYWVSLVFGMHNQVYQQIKSPDGRYMATLAYRDGMTFGYFFVSLQTTAQWNPLQPNDAIPQDEVAEVAEEGLNTITWVGNHKLLVDYNKFGIEEAQFVLQTKTWRDVRIAYRGL
jgi:hypothetical protein